MQSNITPAENNDGDDVPFEKEMVCDVIQMSGVGLATASPDLVSAMQKSRKNKKRKKTTVQDLQPDPLPKPSTTDKLPDKMPSSMQLDAAAVTALAALFVAILA